MHGTYFEKGVIKTKVGVYALSICSDLLYTIRLKECTAHIQYYAKSYNYGKTWDVYRAVMRSLEFVEHIRGSVDDVVKLLDKLNGDVV